MTYKSLAKAGSPTHEADTQMHAEHTKTVSLYLKLYISKRCLVLYLTIFALKLNTWNCYYVFQIKSNAF